MKGAGWRRWLGVAGSWGGNWLEVGASRWGTCLRQSWRECWRVLHGGAAKVVDDEDDQLWGGVFLCSCEVKGEKRVMLKLRGGTAALQVETGWWQGLKRENRVCKECSSGEVQDVTHRLLRCPAWSSYRQPLLTFAQFNTEEDELDWITCCFIHVGSITFWPVLCPCLSILSAHLVLFVYWLRGTSSLKDGNTNVTVIAFNR